jgi:misacylated tRNA(Ala) deacylase
MTELLYQTDSYVQMFNAVVTGIDEANHAVLLNRTAFYPGGGGQLFDTGSLSLGAVVYQVDRPRKSPEGIWHKLLGDAPLPTIGSSVQGQLDWTKRYQLMRTHSAMHILCGVVFRDYGALVTGGDMDPLKARMDFEFETLSKELVGVIEKTINYEAAKGYPIRVNILPREEAFKIPDLLRTKINLLPPEIKEVRVVEIVGLDLQADGGTHVNNTTEIGPIRIVDYKSKGKINKRVYVELS